MHDGPLCLPDEPAIMRRDQHGGSQPVELQEEMQKAFGEHRIDISRWLIGKQKLWLGDHCPGDCGTLLFAT
jgi:hypothetical protein